MISLPIARPLHPLARAVTVLVRGRHFAVALAVIAFAYLVQGPLLSSEAGSKVGDFTLV
jgi:hypothetical protein